VPNDAIEPTGTAKSTLHSYLNYILVLFAPTKKQKLFVQEISILEKKLEL
jgi:hypothetical protein